MSTQLREALTALGASPFVQKVIDPVLVELQRRYTPLVRAVPSMRWTTDIYNWNTRTTVPPGGFVPDGGARIVGNSVFNQAGYKMAHIQSVGSVTGYAEAVTASFGSLRRREIMGATKGYYYDMECTMCWGNAQATGGDGVNPVQSQPQFSGLDTLVSNFDTSTGYPNSIDFAHASLSLGVLDKLADRVQLNAKEPVFNSGWMYIMSTTAISKIAQLLTNQQRFEQVEVAAGLIVPSYRNIPMVETSFLASYGYQMGTITPSTATTGGVIPLSSTYYYKISPIIARAGESVPSAEVSQATGSGTSTSTVTLSFTAPTGYDGLGPQLYKVWRGTSAGAETFLGYVDSTVGLQSDGVTPIQATSIIDTGAALIPQNGSTVPGVLPTQYYGTNSLMLPPSSGDESIYLISRNRDNVVRPYVREAIPLDIYPTTASPDTLPFAIMGDTTFAIRTPRFVGRAARVAVSLTS